jgi:hypothetical protein
LKPSNFQVPGAAKIYNTTKRAAPQNGMPVITTLEVPLSHRNPHDINWNILESSEVPSTCMCVFQPSNYFKTDFITSAQMIK